MWYTFYAYAVSIGAFEKGKDLENDMGILQYIIGSIILVLAVLLIFLITRQQGKRRGLENVISGNSSNNSYLNKTEAAKKGKKFEKWTVYCAIAFVVLVVALYTVTAISKNMDAKDTSSGTSSQATSSQSTSSGSTSSEVESSEEEASSEASK